MKTDKHPHRRGNLFLLAGAALLALASQASAVPRFVLRIVDHDGTVLIPGGATGPHKDWIEVVAFGTRAGIPKSEDGTALGTVCEPGGFTFLKRVDKSTPLLQRALFRGLLLPAVQIKYLGERGSASNGAEPIVVELRHVQVTDYQMHADASGRAEDPVPTEEVTLNYSSTEYIYRERNDQGAVIGESATILNYFAATEDPAFDDDGDGIPNDLDPDDDNDGIPDSAEVAGGSNPFRDDADEDLDGDHQSNRDEAIAGTRMDDASDYFGIERILRSNTRDGLQMTVSIPASGGRHYRLLAALDPRIPTEDWIVLDEFDMPHGTPKTGVDVELNPNILKSVTSLYFRAEVSLLGEPLEPNPIDPLDPNPAPGPPPTPAL